MVFNQTIKVGNASKEKIYVRAIYEKWHQLKFSSSVKLLSGTTVGGGIDFEQDQGDFSVGFTSLAPHQTLTMIGSFFSAEVDAPGPSSGDKVQGGKRLIISRNYRVPNKYSVIVTPQHTVQVVRGGESWRKRCREYCPFMMREKKPVGKLATGSLRRKQRSVPDPCPICQSGKQPKEDKSSP